MRCAKCGTRNSAVSRYCRQCGEPLAQGGAAPGPRYQENVGENANLARARWAAERGDLDTAIQLCRSVIEEHPDSARAHLAVGQYLGQAGFEDLANTHLEIARELDPRVRPESAAVQAQAAALPKPAKKRLSGDWGVLLRKDWARARGWLEARPRLVVGVLAALVVLTGVSLGMTMLGRSRGTAVEARSTSSADPYIRAAERYLAEGNLQNAERMVQYAERQAPGDSRIADLKAELEQRKSTLVEISPQSGPGAAGMGADVPRDRPTDQPLFGGVNPEGQTVLARIFSGGAGGGVANAATAKPGSTPGNGTPRPTTARRSTGAAPLPFVAGAIPPALGERRSDLLPSLGTVSAIQSMGEPWLWTAGPRRPSPQRGATAETSGPAIATVQVPLAPATTAPAPETPTQPSAGAGLTPSRSIAGSVRRVSPAEAARVGAQGGAGGAPAPPPSGAVTMSPVVSGGGTSGAGASASGQDGLLEQARAHQSQGLEYQRQGQWENARREFTAALQACDAAENAGSERAAVGGVRSACQAALKNSGS